MPRQRFPALQKEQRTVMKKNRVLTIFMRNSRHIGVNESLCLKRKWLEKAEEKKLHTLSRL